MAKNEGLSFAGGFGEAFFKTIQSERERQDKLNQQQQEFSQRSREMNLLNAYRNKMYELDVQNQAMNKEKTEYDIRNDYQEIPMMPNAPLFPILQGGEIGSEKNKDFNGIMNPFDEDKFYAPFQQEKKSNLEGSYKNPKTGTYWKYDETNREGIDTQIPYDQNEGRSTTTDINTPQEETTPYINFGTVEEMIRNYNQRTEDGVAMGSSVVSPDQWRIKANEELSKVMKDTGISQELFDTVWELSGIQEGDNAVTKRNKLKNVLDQQPNLNDFQRRALYLGAEVRTR